MRFQALDSWRGLCAILVAVLHFHGAWHFHDAPVVRGGYLFVDFFFVLSGFVLAHAYDDRIRDMFELGGFVIQRFGRVWPLHVTVLGLFLAVELVALALEPWLGSAYPREPFTGSRSPFAVLTNLLLIHSLGLHQDVTWNFPSWSISAEFFTSLAFGVMMLLTVRYRNLVSALLVLASAAIVLAFANSASIDVTVDYGFFRCMVGFFLGYLAYQVFRAARAKLKGVLPAAGLIEAACVVLVVGFTAAVEVGPLSYLAPFVFTLTVLVFAFEDGWVSTLLKNRLMLRLGALSYSIYMVHAFLLLIIENSTAVAGKLLRVQLSHDHMSIAGKVKLIDLGGPWVMDGVIVAYLVAVVALAALTYRFVEMPGYAYSKRIARRLGGGATRTVTDAAQGTTS
ncbi:acyltransferase [Skermanella stibiiresistens SB22]|uniref:Acyltransferase n=1 Tax=Skermanella stibiiresistens SB22 TaxID=1385369 RepID=W9H4P6_9PROT|nr:acyltransferase [Skermanella stibiiresistens]EWY39662.1 acyltransferase [Skermanella stibiiresistens SB22]